jgi:tripartite-type tricarboxylate transporter receptor subunit TctC
MALDAASTSLPHIQAGKLRALGVTTSQRAFFAPELPAIAELVPGFEMNPWHGVMAPAGTPSAIVEKLDREIQVFLKRPDTIAKLRERGVVPGGAGPQAFARQIADDLALYQSVIRKTGIKGE